MCCRIPCTIQSNVEGNMLQYSDTGWDFPQLITEVIKFLLIDAGFEICHVSFASPHHFHQILRHYSPAETGCALSVTPLCYQTVAITQDTNTPIACTRMEVRARWSLAARSLRRGFAAASLLGLRSQITLRAGDQGHQGCCAMEIKKKNVGHRNYLKQNSRRKFFCRSNGSTINTSHIGYSFKYIVKLCFCF